MSRDEPTTQGAAPPSGAAICTIASKNYLAHVRVLTESLHRFHPEVPVYFLLVDRLEGCYDPAAEPFVTVGLEDLAIEHLGGFCFQYTCLELNTAVKPFLLAHLFARLGARKLFYFDPDIKFYGPLNPLLEALDTAAVVLVPHLTEPLLDEAKPNELEILRSGAYNLGFIGLSAGPVSERLLSWWQQKLYKHCVVDHDAGYFVDQRWMDLVPGMFEGVRIVRDPGCDVAYWNLQHRRLECADGRFLVNGGPLRFAHFSGFNPDRKEVISKHQNRYTLSEVPCLPELFADYEQDLMRHGYRQVQQWPYAFATFDDGTPIPDLVREIYREFPYDVERFGDPFAAGPGSFFDWLNAPADGNSRARPVITNLVREIYVRRPDLQQAFPNPMGRDRLPLARWMIVEGVRAYDLDRRFAEALNLPSARPTTPAGPGPERKPAAALAIGEPLAWRGAILRSLARTGAGRIARRVLGPDLAARVRDRVRWGRHAGRRLPPPLPTGRGARNRVAMTQGAFGVNVVGYLCSESGLGEAGRSIARAARAADLPAAGLSMDFYAGHRKLDSSCPDLAPGNPHRFNIFCVSVDAVLQTLDRLGAEFYARKYNIASWFWELQDLPQEWLAAFDYLDEVWAPSSFVQQALAPRATIPVVRMPVGVEVTDIAPPPPEVRDLPPDRFVFFYMFDYHSHAERKHPLGALRAFHLAFSERDPVHLVLKGTDSRKNPAYHERLLQHVRPGQVTIIDRYLDRPLINGLLQRCDCYVSLHRSEGFGFTPAEAMYLGKPVIATAYGGNTDFMRPDNSYLVPYRLVEIDQDYGPYRRGWQWADPDLEAAARLMREVYENREQAARRAAAGQRLMREAYSHAAIGRAMRERLEVLAGL